MVSARPTRRPRRLSPTMRNCPERSLMGTEARFARRNENNPEASAYVSASSFVDYGEKKISVDRYDRMSIGDAVKRGEQMAQWRGTNRQFHGWAVLTRADVISLGFDARPAQGVDIFGMPTYSCPTMPPRTKKLTTITRRTLPALQCGWRDQLRCNSPYPYFCE